MLFFECQGEFRVIKLIKLTKLMLPPRNHDGGEERVRQRNFGLLGIAPALRRHSPTLESGIHENRKAKI